MAKDLRSFLEELSEQRPNDIVMVEDEVESEHITTAYAEKFEKEGEFPVIYFKKVKGSDIPLVCNIGASYERLALSMGSDSIMGMIKDVARREVEAKACKEIPQEKAPVKEIKITGDDIDLDILPIVVHNEHDAGPYVDAGPTVMKDRDTGAHNMGLYRLQKHSKNRLGIMINPANHGHHIRQDYEDNNEDTPVVIPIGHHPAFVMASVSRVASIGGEYEAAGGLLDEPLEVVKAETNDLMVPARAEIVIEGYIPANKRQYEGTFGEWPRYYAKKGEQPYIEVTAITMRKNPIYMDINAAHPEHNMIGAVPRLGSLYDRIKTSVPNLKAINMPISALARTTLYASIHKRSEGEPNQVAFAAFATDYNIKHVMVVDDDINVFNEEEVLFAIATRFEADKNLAIIPNSLGGHLNPTSYGYNRLEKGIMQTKLVFDCTKPLNIFFPEMARVPASIFDSIDTKKSIKPFDKTVLT